jgi:hypothetical protein
MPSGGQTGGSCFSCGFPKDQPGHGLSRFAKLGATRTSREPLGTAAHSFLNRRSEVRGDAERR